MALYKYAQYIQQSDDVAFDKLYSPGDTVPHSGIYRCAGCGRETANNENQPFPPQNHHQHHQNQGSIRWKLIVWADHNPK